MLSANKVDHRDALKIDESDGSACLVTQASQLLQEAVAIVHLAGIHTHMHVHTWGYFHSVLMQQQPILQ